MRRVIQPAVIKIVQRQVVEYTCDKCGRVCGTKANPKTTWYRNGRESHRCKRECGPAGHV